MAAVRRAIASSACHQKTWALTLSPFRMFAVGQYVCVNVRLQFRGPVSHQTTWRGVWFFSSSSRWLEPTPMVIVAPPNAAAWTTPPRPVLPTSNGSSHQEPTLLLLISLYNCQQITSMMQLNRRMISPALKLKIQAPSIRYSCRKPETRPTLPPRLINIWRRLRCRAV